MGFLDGLRFESRFPTGGTSVNVKAKPANMSGAMTHREQAQREERINRDLARQILSQKQREKNEEMDKPMNVVYDRGPDYITAKEKEDLRLREKQIDTMAQSRDNTLEFQREKQAQDSAVRQQRADVYAFKAKNPSARIIVQRGGDIIAYDPVNNQVLRSFGSSGQLSEEDRIELENAGRMNLEGVRAQNAQALEGTRQTGRIALEQERGTQQRQTNAEKPDDGMLPTQQKVQQYLLAKKLASDPDNARYFRFSGANDFTMVPPGYLGGDFEKYKQLVAQVYGDNPPEDNSTVTPVVTPTSPPQGQPNTSGKVMMIGPDGKKGYVPSNRVNDYTKGGYKVVQPGGSK